MPLNAGLCHALRGYNKKSDGETIVLFWLIYLWRVS